MNDHEQRIQHGCVLAALADVKEFAAVHPEIPNTVIDTAKGAVIGTVFAHAQTHSPIKFG